MRHVLQKQSYQLQKVVQQAQKLQALNELVQQHINPQFRSHCFVANYQRSSMVLATDTAAIATLLRYELPRLLRQLRQVEGFAGLANIKVKVSKNQTVAKSKAKPQPELSVKGRQYLQQLADSLDDGELHDAVESLAKDHSKD